MASLVNFIVFAFLSIIFCISRIFLFVDGSHVVDFVAVSPVMALLICSFCKFPARSWYTVAEFVILFLLRCCFPYAMVSFTSFYTAKLLVSFIHYRLRSHKGLVPLYYFMGFKSDKLHSAIGYDGNTYHYAFPKGKRDNEDVDSMFNLAPQKLPYLPQTKITARCGFAYPGLSDNDILKMLESCGRCHNWALITLYETSSDKFLSMATLSFLRWDVWVILSACFVCFISAAAHGGFLLALNTCGMLCEFAFLILAIIDSLNMNVARLQTNSVKKHAFSNPHLTDALKFFGLFFVWYVLFRLFALIPYFGPCPQFFTLLVLTMLITHLMNDGKMFHRQVHRA